MIASLSGKIIQVEPGSLVIEVGGVGLLVNVPTPLADQHRVGDNAFLFTQLIVRQDSLALSGFESAEGREFFNLLLTVDGIGPRLALAVLSTLDPDAIRRAVFTEQADLFSMVSGVGKKTAQKILLQLKDRLPVVEGFAPTRRVTPTPGHRPGGRAGGRRGRAWPGRSTSTTSRRWPRR